MYRRLSDIYEWSQPTSSLVLLENGRFCKICYLDLSLDFLNKETFCLVKDHILVRYIFLAIHTKLKSIGIWCFYKLYPYSSIEWWNVPISAIWITILSCNQMGSRRASIIQDVMISVHNHHVHKVADYTQTKNTDRSPRKSEIFCR